MVLRSLRRLADAEADLREALEICRALGERSIIAWTASELVRVRLLRGDRSGAREITEQPYFMLTTAETGARVAPLVAESLLALADGDRDRALALATEALQEDQRGGWRNFGAARVWWVGRLFGADAVGGEEAMEEARTTLESAHWIAAIREP